MSNFNRLGGVVSAASFLGRIKKRTWIIIGLIALCILGLLLWLVISVAAWLFGQAAAGSDAGARFLDNTLAQVEQVIPNVSEPLETLVPDAKQKALAVVEQAQNVVPELQKQVEEIVPDIRLPVAAPTSDVSGNDLGPVARFPGLVRTAFVRDAETVSVDYQGKALLKDVVAHYVAGFTAAGFTHEVISADMRSEQHAFTQNGSSIRVSLEQSTAQNVQVKFVQDK